MFAILDLTIPNVAGFAAILYLLGKALYHRAEAIDLQARTRHSAIALQRDLPTLPRRAPGDVLLRMWGQLETTARVRAAEHPTARILNEFTENPTLADDDLAVRAWLADAVGKHFGPLQRASELTVSTAAPVGLVFTLIGLQLGLSTFAEAMDTSAMMGSIALALLTTLGAAVVVMLERRVQMGILRPLKAECAVHATLWLARAKALKRVRNKVRRRAARRIARPSRTEPKQPAMETANGGPV